MGFLVEFEINIPERSSNYQVIQTDGVEEDARSAMRSDGRLVGPSRQRSVFERKRVMGLYWADNVKELDCVLNDLPLNRWMRITFRPRDSCLGDFLNQRLIDDDVALQVS